MNRGLKAGEKKPNSFPKTLTRAVLSVDDFIHSSLFHEVYLKKDLPLDYPELFQGPPTQDFSEFYEQFRNLVHAHTPDDRQKWTHSETVKFWIGPILQILGWGIHAPSGAQTFIENTSFNVVSSEGEEISLKPGLLVGLDRLEKERLLKARGNEREGRDLKSASFIPVATGYYNAWADQIVGQYDVAKDEIGRRGDVYSSLGPNLQMQKYFSLLDKEWGIATDGAIWRLYNASSSRGHADRFFEFNLQALADYLRTTLPTLGSKDSNELEEMEFVLRYFFWFFSRSGSQRKPISFIEEVAQKAKRYAAQIKEDLKGRFVYAMTIACNGYRKAFTRINRREPNLQLLHNTAESLVFNLLFVRSCESKRILPMNQAYLPKSLSNLVLKLRDYDPQKSWTENRGLLQLSLKRYCGDTFNDHGTELYEHVLKLHDLIQMGTGSRNDFGFEIEGFKESVFNKEESIFFHEVPISNEYMVKLLFELNYDKPEDSTFYQEIPYSIFAPRQLGSIYESFLEFKLDHAEHRLLYICRTKKENGQEIKEWQWISNEEAQKNGKYHASFSVNKGDIIFTPNNSERKATGSYYTPGYIVEHIVRGTLKPLIDKNSANAIQNIKVCDPAMGSGHFLISALNFLAEAVQTRLQQKPHLSDIKREILEKCIFGVDMNPRAVKLTKMALWLESAFPRRKLQRLDFQIRCGHSLLSNMAGTEYQFDWAQEFLSKFQGFDAIIGNPPWGMADIQIENLNPHVGPVERQKNLNLFDLFTRLSLSVVKKPHGRIGFLVPRNFLRKEMYSGLRALLLPMLEGISDIGKFPGVIQEACALFLNSPASLSSFFVDTSLKKNVTAKIAETRVEKKYITGPNYVIQIETNTSLEIILDKIKRHTPLQNLCTIARGIECGKRGEFVCCSKCSYYFTPPKKRNKKGVFEKTCPNCGLKVTLKTAPIENIIFDKPGTGRAPIVAGPDIRPEAININRWIRLRLEGINYKKKLFRSGPRIFVPMNNDKIVAAIDKTESALATKTAYVIRPKRASVNLRYIEAVLNSTAVQFYFEYAVNCGGRLTNSISSTDLGNVPIPDVNEVPQRNLNIVIEDAAVSRYFGLTESELEEISEFLKSNGHFLPVAA